MSFKENFTQFIDAKVNAAIDELFGDAHEYAQSNSGDITPEQQHKLDNIKESLKPLIITQTLQNLSEEQRKELNLSSNDCIECGFDLGEGYANCAGADDGTCPECGTFQDDPDTALIVTFNPEFYNNRKPEEMTMGDIMAAAETDVWTDYSIKQIQKLEAGEVWDRFDDDLYGLKVEKVFKEEQQWNVPVMRIGYSHTLMAVSSRSKSQAIAKAIDKAGGESFSESSAEYEAPDGAMLIK